MSHIKIEIWGKTFTTKGNETAGIRVRGTNLGIAYTANKDSGRVVVAQRNNYPDPEHEYVQEKLITIHQGENPIIEDIECRSINGQKKIIKAKISVE